MSANNAGGTPEELSTLDIIQQLKNGQVNPKALDIKTRIDCAELLLYEGYTRAQIAQILKTSDRTVTRYYKAIRKRNALKVTPDFPAEYMGQLIARTQHGIDYMIRLSGAKDAKTMEKVQARKEALQACFELTRLLQAGGYLPSPSTVADAAISDSKPIVIKVVGKKAKKGPNEPTSGTA